MFARVLPLLLSLGVVVQAAVIGTNPPARALTAETIATLPAPEQPASVGLAKEADQALRFEPPQEWPARRAGLHRAVGSCRCVRRNRGFCVVFAVVGYRSKKRSSVNSQTR